MATNNFTTYAAGNEDALQKQIKELKKKNSEYQKMIKSMISNAEEIHGPTVVPFLDTPVDKYDALQQQLAKLNPDLFQKSKEIDAIRGKIDMIDNGRLNLEKAYSDMKLAAQQQRNAINQGADAGLSSLAKQQEIQRGALTGLAGNAGATSGMLANANAEVANKFAPLSQQVEQQRQGGLAGVAQLESQIPAAMSGIQAQNIINKSNILSNKRAQRALSTPVVKSSRPPSIEDILASMSAEDKTALNISNAVNEKI